MDVTFAAGFSSARRLNETMRDVFDMTPREIRNHHRREDAAAPPTLVSVELPVRQPFDALGVFGFLATRAIDGVETADLTDPGCLRYARTLALPHGPGAAEVVATRTPGAASDEWRLRAKLDLSSLADVATAVSRVRRMMDLDADPLAVDAALSMDPALAPLVERTPGIRVPGTVDPHEIVVRAMIGQQISVARAIAHLSSLASRLGSSYTSAIPGLDRLFPTAGQIAEGVPVSGENEPLDPDRPLRLPRQSVRAIVATAHALASGDLDVDVGAEAEALREQLLSRPRIGPWTAAYIAMRVLGDPDAWLDGDVALVAGAKVLGILDPNLSKAPAHRALATRAIQWAPWRSYAAMHLWQAPSTAAHTGASQR